MGVDARHAGIGHNRSQWTNSAGIQQTGDCARRAADIGQPGEVLPLACSYIPLPPTRAAREASGDPRLSVEERYGSRARYQTIVTDRAEKLVQEGYMLPEDIDIVISRALARSRM